MRRPVPRPRLVLNHVMRTALGLALVFVACGGADSDEGDEAERVSVEPGWVLVEGTCGDGYSFFAPPEISREPVQGIDSCVERWATSTCSYAVDYGMYSNDLTGYADLPQYERAEKVIDGRKARVITALSEERFVAAVHFAGIDPESERVALTLWVSCTDEAGRKQALAAFDTIVFEARE